VLRPRGDRSEQPWIGPRFAGRPRWLGARRRDRSVPPLLLTRLHSTRAPGSGGAGTTPGVVVAPPELEQIELRKTQAVERGHRHSDQNRRSSNARSIACVIALPCAGMPRSRICGAGHSQRSIVAIVVARRYASPEVNKARRYCFGNAKPAFAGKPPRWSWGNRTLLRQCSPTLVTALRPWSGSVFECPLLTGVSRPFSVPSVRFPSSESLSISTAIA
jgi:hypothetical protein